MANERSNALKGNKNAAGPHKRHVYDPNHQGKMSDRARELVKRGIQGKSSAPVGKPVNAKANKDTATKIFGKTPETPISAARQKAEQAFTKPAKASAVDMGKLADALRKAKDTKLLKENKHPSTGREAFAKLLKNANPHYGGDSVIRSSVLKKRLKKIESAKDTSSRAFAKEIAGAKVTKKLPIVHGSDKRKPMVKKPPFLTPGKIAAGTIAALYINHQANKDKPKKG